MKKLPILKECALVRRISQTSVKRVNVDIKFEIILLYFYGKKGCNRFQTGFQLRRHGNIPTGILLHSRNVQPSS
jgi:hypothetical protein